MSLWVRLSVPFVVVGGQDLTEHAYQVLDHLYELDGILDPDVSLDTGEHLVTLELLCRGDDQFSAARAGVDAMRTAIHAAGGMTHGWEDAFADLSDLTLFPVGKTGTEWEPTQTTFTKVLVDA